MSDPARVSLLSPGPVRPRRSPLGLSVAASPLVAASSLVAASLGLCLLASPLAASPGAPEPVPEPGPESPSLDRGSSVEAKETVDRATNDGATNDGATNDGAMADAAMADTGEPTLERIMSDPIWMGTQPQAPYWSADGEHIYFYRDRAGDHDLDLVRVPTPTDAATVYGPDDLELIEGGLWAGAEPSSRHFSRARDRAVFERHGDLFVVPVDSEGREGELRQLTRTHAREQRPFFLHDGQRVAYELDGQPFVHHLETGLVEQLADLRTGDDPDEEPEPDAFLDRQQTRLLRWVRETQERREAEEERDRVRREEDVTAPPEPVYLGKKVEVDRLSLSPAGDALLVVTQVEERDRGRRDQMPSYVSEDGYVEMREVRAKVGTGDGTGNSLLFLDLVDDTRTELDLSVLPGITDDPLAEIRAATEARREAEKKAEEAKAEEKGADDEAENDASDDETGEKDSSETDASENGDEDAEPEPRAVDVERTEWSPDGRWLAVQAHSIDNKDRWIALVSRAEPELRPVHRLTMEGWINWSYNQLGWLDDGRLWFLSEESGWSQLYLYDPESAETRRLTEGDMVVSSPQLDPGQRYLYYTANPDHPGIYDTYRVDLQTGANEQVSHLGGQTWYSLSPDGSQLLLEHSTTTQPVELWLQEARPDAEARPITDLVSAEFEAFDWVAPEIVEVPSSHHDRPIYSRFYAAAETDRYRGADGKRPAVLFVHGAGYLQNSHQGFSGYFREFMFHTLLTRQGYHVLDMDYRASAGYGAEWRTAIYRQMGTPELEDFEDGVRWLTENHDVDPERIGIYGGSYGGFMTMMALFQRPGLFAAGAALRPVTDWAHYNHPYTSNILNTPEVDPEAYERSSPIEFADGLEDPLLICAPMLDDNVFFQDTVRLAQRFIELGVQGWEVALYPIEPHGFREPYSWLDEYRRIHDLFEEHLAPDF